MSHYHFNVYDGRSVLDEDGSELPDLQTARVEALRLAGQIIRDTADRGEMAEDWRVEVTDHAGLVLFRMEFVVVETPAAKGTGLPN